MPAAPTTPAPAGLPLPRPAGEGWGEGYPPSSPYPASSPNPRGATGPTPPRQPPPPPEPPPPELPTLTPEELHVATALITPGGHTSPLALAPQLNLDPHAFLAIARRPAVQAWVRAAIEIEDIRIDLIARRAKADALDTLATITKDPAVEPVERRRAASAILRALAPPRAPRAVEGSETDGLPRGSQSGAPPARPRWTGPPPADDVDAYERYLQARFDSPFTRSQDDIWTIEGDILANRLGFRTPQGAAEATAKLLTTADPQDPEATLMALFLLSGHEANFGDPEKFFAATRHLLAAAGGSITLLERNTDNPVHAKSHYATFHMILQPPDPAAPPLDLALRMRQPTPGGPFWSLTGIRPWNGGAALEADPWNATEAGYPPAPDPP